MNNDNNILHRRDKKEMDKGIDDAMSKINFDNINVGKSIRDLFKHLGKKISRKFDKKDKKSKIDKTE